MTAHIVFGTANPPLARAVAAALATEPVSCDIERFPDGELRPAVGHLRGEDVYVVQPTPPPVNENLVELMLVLDACRRAGAGRVTAVVPYLGYARQDRRGRAGEAVGARVVAEALTGAGAERLVVVDPHTVALEAMCPAPVEMLTAVPVLADALAPTLSDDAVLVAPDLGAVKLAERFGGRLHRRVVVVQKSRTSGTTVQAEELVGHVEGCRPVIVDDMISTAGTIEASVRVLLAHGALPEIVVAATHGPLVAGATDLLARLPVRRVFVTDSIPGPSPPPPGLLDMQSIAPLLADAVTRLHRNQPMDDLLVRS